MTTRFEEVRRGALEKDGVQIVHYEPQFAAGSKSERRMVRLVSLMFLLSGLFAFAFVAVYIWWPFTDFPSVKGWEYQPGASWMKGYTPVLGLCLGLSLCLLALGILTWGKKLLPHEVALQDRHDGGSAPEERRLTGQTLMFIGEEMGVTRRPLLKVALLAPVGGVALAAAAVPVGMLIKNPHKPDNILFETGWNTALNGGNPVRLMHEDGKPIRPEDVSVGGQITAFPMTKDGLGATNKHADSPILLIHLRQDDADTLRANTVHQPKNVGGMYGNLVAYSKICTHAGCPASLYEQQSNKLLCPCHQSQFLITDNAKPIFGPATRRLPMLPLGVDGEGYLVGLNDFNGVPVGPAFWEKPEA